MKLNIFDDSSFPNGTGRNPNVRPLIALNRKSGLSRLNFAATEMMKLKEGGRIRFGQDPDKPGTWFIIPSTEKGFVLRNKKVISAGLFFNSTKMVGEIMQSIKYQERSLSLFIREESIKHDSQLIWGLDVKLPNQK